MIIVLLADGFEEIEALTPVDMLRRAGLKVKTVGINNRVPTGSHGISVVCDAMPEDINLSKVKMVILPGGMPGTLNLDKSPFVEKAISAMIKNEGRIAAICAAPMVLGRRGLLKGVEATCYPGFEKELRGANLVDRDVVTDGNITTARGMGVALEFSEELLSFFIGKTKTEDMSASICKRAIHTDTKEENNEKTDESNDEETTTFFSLKDFFASRGRTVVEEEKPAPVAKPISSLILPNYPDYKFPSIDLLTKEDATEQTDDTMEEIKKIGDKIIETLAAFNVSATIGGIDHGPRVTRYEIIPAKGVKVNAILNLQDDIALNIAVGSIRMEAPIPGKSAVGIEVPNRKASLVRLRDLLETEEFKSSRSDTFIPLGRDIAGQPIYGDVTKMPHLLIGGATGMGKSVLMNSIICSMLMKARPEEVKLVMIDPKQVEFTDYKRIPHLLCPIITDPKIAVGALSWLIGEMERRYNLFQSICIRNLDSYNEKVKADPTLGSPLPKIIVVIDELADLMLQVKDPIETLIMRLAQKARAAGIHLIIGTQRPSVNVITGVLRANIPSRICCKVMSNVDSKTMLDCSGAEKLLDRGDSLYALAGSPKPQRMQTAYISDGEVNALLSSISVNEETEIFDPTVIDVFRAELEKFPKLIKRPSEEDEEKEEAEDGSIFQDQCFLEAVELTLSLPKISTSLLQKKLSIGFGRAMRYLDNMEKLELISPMNGQRPRDVIATPDEWHQSLLLAGITPLTPKKEEIEEEDLPTTPTRLIRASAEEISAYENDRQFIQAVEIALSVGKISTSLIQRQLSIGYGKAAKFIDMMEDMGIVSEANGHRPREIRITPEEWKAKLERIMEDKN